MVKDLFVLHGPFVIKAAVLFNFFFYIFKPNLKIIQWCDFPKHGSINYNFYKWKRKAYKF